MFQVQLASQQGHAATANRLWAECPAYFRQSQDTAGIAETLSLTPAHGQSTCDLDLMAG
jgi:hypothetical protein